MIGIRCYRGESFFSEGRVKKRVLFSEGRMVFPVQGKGAFVQQAGICQSKDTSA